MLPLCPRVTAAWGAEDYSTSMPITASASLPLPACLTAPCSVELSQDCMQHATLSQTMPCQWLSPALPLVPFTSPDSQWLNCLETWAQLPGNLGELKSWWGSHVPLHQGMLRLCSACPGKAQ